MIIKFLLRLKLLNKFTLIVIFLLTGSQSFAQDYQADLVLVNKQNFEKKEFRPRKVTYLFADAKSPLVKYNPLSLTFGSLMFVYQKVFSAQFSTNCAYEISCSSFSKMCIHRYGMVKGIALSADRLTRCTQFAASDIHHLDIDKKIHKVRDHPEKYQARH